MKLSPQTSLNPEILALQLPSAPLAQIASIIRKDWTSASSGFQYAFPYLQAMFRLSSIDESSGADSGRDIVLYFLANAGTWRGPVAKLVKAELRSRLSKRS